MERTIQNLFFLSLLILMLQVDQFSLAVVRRTSEASEPLAASAPEGIDCGSACEYRCSKASRHKMCIRACGTCCARCHCVPPGTSGNEDVCPCYANMTTHGGRHKCP
ncbi:hypothetical protein AMTRI_Chr11g98190 [Amborella trichopoda]|uniref:Uncharacterized protein n=1 Tax=Amborella trichopoda TaxID=13333 RepID=W1PKF9_AMBTC|nr:snakin-2 [Amborella trichopoda]ERN08523.1 hypothetical protein AMTR_s00017p00002980 [Amborella trichopoda]|eukprot:XP_006846942.1 snakin-2 [Amborella trichopoda]